MAKSKIPAPPKTLRVLGKELAILKVPRGALPDEAIGLYDRDNGRIAVVSGLSASEEAETLLHETLHAVVASMLPHKMKEEDEEEVVAAFSSGLYAVLQDNPKFAKWLITKR